MSKRWWSLAIAAAILAHGIGAGAQQKVLLLPREVSEAPDYMIEKEANVMIHALVEAGYQVDVATESGESVCGKKLTLKADLKISEVNLDNYIGILMPCMAAPSFPQRWHAPLDQVALIQRAAKRGLIIGAQAGSLIVLADAKLLAGKPYTCYTNPTAYGNQYAEGHYAGKGLVRNSNIIISGDCPYATYLWEYKDGTDELLAEFIGALQERVSAAGSASCCAPTE